MVLGSEDGIKGGFLFGILIGYDVAIENGIKYGFLFGLLLGFKYGINMDL